jgi:hypothetical protein
MRKKKKKKVKKVKNQDFIGKTNYFLRTMPFSPWAVSALGQFEPHGCM